MKPVRTAARAMLAGIFVASGARTLTNPDRLVPAAQPFADRVGPLMAKVHKRAPTDARTLVQINGTVHFVGGLLLLTGLRRPAAAALAASMAPTTLTGHRFWEERDPAVRSRQQTQLLKNLGLMGGLLLAALDTEGRPSLRYRATRLAHDADRAVRRTTRQARRSVKLATRAAELGRHLPG
jgi:putative oxidoreductase